MFDQLISNVEAGLTWFVEHFDGPLWDITVITLLGVGIFFTLTTGLVQLRLFPQSLREMWFGRSSDGQSLTPFPSLCNRAGEPCWGGEYWRCGNGDRHWWRRCSVLDVGNGVDRNVECFCRIFPRSAFQTER